MCGRYALHRDPAALAGEFDAADRTGDVFDPDYNITPTATVPIVVERAAGSGAERTLRPVRWGLVPTWAEDASSGPQMVNARAESLTAKPAYAEAAAHRRCLMPATGWYEWKPGERVKQPYLCTRRDGRSLAMAAVFSAWWPPDSAAEPLVTCAVVTTEAVGELAEVHHRMPLVLGEHRRQEWLDPQRTDVTGLLSVDAASLDAMELRPVSEQVNSPRNNHSGLLERVDPAARPAVAVQPALFES
ncbi:putative SOS response-associated peptidase YedK [Halopolyspora algeriensis]|uniref:Abasic site processing protein n=1 Tax=Halopolyspora algeriensis TaxID=1500506 RepID=A0A368VU67_9ACTN|nr:SOS response-associated peptidase [Halopolyspora algeriensis]RCW45361.1 putative SOS response-associated peptidase YedK [Halopolyspora algeriensis]TQM47401.1 putative SOS response-associated peptidase YedK [Halopolyspora algeriensis]